MAIDINININQPNTTVVNISSAQILAMGSTPIELLPAAGANKYYDIENVILEYTYVSGLWVNNFPRFFSNGVGLNYVLSNESFDGIPAENCVFNIKDIQLGNTTGYPINTPVSLNGNLELSTADYFTDPSGFIGSFKAIITYTLRTFGA